MWKQKSDSVIHLLDVSSCHCQIGSTVIKTQRLHLWSTANSISYLHISQQSHSCVLFKISQKPVSTVGLLLLIQYSLFKNFLLLSNNQLGAIHLWCPKKSGFWPPPPVHMRPHGSDPPLWTSTRGRHEIHTALLKWLVQWPTGLKAEIRLYDSNLFKLYY